jgi:hypothetical protein
MRQRLPTGLRAIECCLKLDDLDGQWCVPADMWVIFTTSSGSLAISERN